MPEEWSKLFSNLFASAIFTIIFALVLPSTSYAASWYVSPSGGGDGSTSTTPKQIQYAINGASSGDVIYFAAGTYVLGVDYGTSISVSKNLEFIGAGIDQTIIDNTTQYATINESNASFRDMTFQNSPQMTFSSMKADLVLDTIKIQNAHGGVDGYATDGTNSLIAQNVQMEHLSSYAVDLGGTDNNLTISDSVFMDTGGIHVNDSNVDVTRNTFENSTNTAVQINNNFSTSPKVATILDNTFVNGNDDNIYLFSYHSVQTGEINRNTITGGLNGIFIGGQDLYLTLTINANYISASDSGIRLSCKCIVTNNVVENVTDNGIYAMLDNSIIAFNTVVGSGSAGYATARSDTSFYNNIAYGNKFGFGTEGVHSLAYYLATLGYNLAFSNTYFEYASAEKFRNLGGNRSVGPLFVSATNYYLQSTSPAIDAASLYTVATDFTGKERSDGALDIGAYEWGASIDHL